MAAHNFDREEILRTWQIFRQPGEVLELRIPEAGRHKTISGYFNDPGKLADAVIALADEPFPGIYFSVNPVKPALLARATNRYVKYAKTTTSDADIAALHWLPIDVDARLPAGISSTDAEHEAAIAKAREIRQWLIEEHGWPANAFVVADSGNGGHLNVKIDLENGSKNVAWIKGCLEALDFLFSDDMIRVDVTSQNPARIWKLYGTMVRKGDNTPERPHRLARLLEVPETTTIVTTEQLGALAAMLPEPEEQPKTSYTGQGVAFDPVAYCQTHNLQVHHTKSYQGGTLAVLEQCVFNLDHHLSACIIGWPSGARTYRCRHHSCLSKHWKEARAAIEGEGSRLDKNSRRLEEIHQDAQRAKGKAWAQGEPSGDPGQEEGGKISAEDLKTELKADRRKILDPVFLHKLLRLSPLEREALIGEAKDEGLLPKGVRTSTIYREIEQLSATLQRQKHDEDEGAKADIDPGVREKALAIATRGDSLKYLVWQGQRNHLGDISYQKVLIGSIASSASLTSNGIQPGGTGDKGSGKSDACVAVYHLVPEGRRLDGSLSPMSLFYLQEKGLLQPGMVLFSDDVEYEGITPIYKRSTARFQHGITHYTVSSGKNREALELKIPPRMVWWLTSVESVANEQAFDRQYPISTDSSLGHKTRVAKEIAARRARKELRLAVDEGILVAREIFADIFDNGPFQVVIPQADKAEWIKVADFRGQEQFWDLVDALAILRWRQRRRDGNGWLIADDQDLIEAKDIMMGHKVAHISDLTESEVKVVGVLTDGLPHTQKEITEALGIAQSTLSERLKSIMAKSAIITEDFEHGRKLYSINPNMNINAGYWQNLELIHLKIDSEEAYRRQQIALSPCYRYLIGIPIGIYINISNRIPSSLSVNLEGVLDLSQCGVCLGLKKEREIYTPAENTDNAQNQQQEPSSDTDKSTNPPPIDTDNANSDACDIPIRSSGGSVASKKRPDPNHLVWVRFLKDYRTQILRQGTANSWIDKLYLAGEKAQFPEWKAAELVKAGIAELVEA